jgi:DNA gyrase subunit A
VSEGSAPTAIEEFEPIEVHEEMERSFLEYSMSVIVSRALPDARDGLKPVHRRILWGMWDQGRRPDRPHVKSATVVGDVMGRFHPHGDQAIYDALARMVQTFSLRHPLIDGHGEFGSPSPNDGPAAMRYTECRLAPLALSLLDGIEEETVEFGPNYDGSDRQPLVLPSRFPNLLVNGSQGIAVGMATNIPPHNLGEVVDAARYLLEHPDAAGKKLTSFVEGPDFPTGGLIVGREGIDAAHGTGRGSLKLRAVATIADAGHRIVITEIPYQTSVEGIAEEIADAVDRGDLVGIAATSDESSGDDTKFVIELKKDADAHSVLASLFRLTHLQTTFGVNMLALVDGVPRVITLEQAIRHWVDFQIEVVTRRSRYRLERARRRAHIVEGLLRAVDKLDAVVKAIRSSSDRTEARRKLMDKPFSFSEDQAVHVLDLTLGRLTRLGREELETELAGARQQLAAAKDGSTVGTARWSTATWPRD